MTTWADLATAEPDFMTRVQARFDSHLHKFLATVRADGSPRISGIETSVSGGELWLAGMPQGRKFADLRRDPRLALHSGSPESDPDDPAAWPGDAKLSGVAVEVTDESALEAYRAAQELDMPPGAFELFRVDLREVVLIGMGDPADHLVIEHWHEGRGLQRTARA
jgi:hypothetical protein